MSKSWNPLQTIHPQKLPEKMIAVNVSQQHSQENINQMESTVRFYKTLSLSTVQFSNWLTEYTSRKYRTCEICHWFIHQHISKCEHCLSQLGIVQSRINDCWKYWTLSKAFATCPESKCNRKKVYDAGLFICIISRCEQAK